jgi:hypothetical protein
VQLAAALGAVDDIERKIGGHEHNYSNEPLKTL